MMVCWWDLQGMLLDALYVMLYMHNACLLLALKLHSSGEWHRVGVRLWSRPDKLVHTQAVLYCAMLDLLCILQALSSF